MPGKGLGTAVLWVAVCVAIALLGPGPALGAAVDVDARSAHRAVWKVYGAGKTGTAFAIGDHHFATCAHVIKDFSDHGAAEVFINRYGSKDSRTLRVLNGDLAWTACRDYSSVAACIEQATRQARELAEAGDRVAQYQLGRDNGNLDKAPVMLLRAAEGGFASAQFSMGMRLKERKQWTEAARWFGRSAEQGDPAGQTEFALRLYRGQGVTRDRVRAFRFMLEAARSGDMVAQYNVGVCTRTKPARPSTQIRSQFGRQVVDSRIGR